jgi:hypothetical protein
MQLLTKQFQKYLCAGQSECSSGDNLIRNVRPVLSPAKYLIFTQPRVYFAKLQLRLLKRPEIFCAGADEKIEFNFAGVCFWHERKKAGQTLTITSCSHLDSVFSVWKRE